MTLNLRKHQIKCIDNIDSYFDNDYNNKALIKMFMVLESLL